MDKYAVIGNPIAHSKSPVIHTMFAEQTEQALQYTALLGELDNFESQVLSLFNSENFQGLNVTVPFKERAFAMCDELSDRAIVAEAVNTLYRVEGRLVGDNTDGAGLVNDLTHNHGIELAGKKILLLGAGGASKGVLLPLLKARPSSLVLANRTFAKAQALVGRYTTLPELSDTAQILEAREFDALNEPFDVVINGTSASLSGDLPKISSEVFNESTYVYDMMYGDGETVFNRWARAQGAGHTMDGLGMLVEQAAEAFWVWRHRRPDTASCIAALRRP